MPIGDDDGEYQFACEHVLCSRRLAVTIAEEVEYEKEAKKLRQIKGQLLEGKEKHIWSPHHFAILLCSVPLEQSIIQNE